MNKPLLSFSIILSAAFYTTPVRSADIHVPADFSGIQSAINAAQDGDTVIVAPGWYFPSSITINKPITLQGTETARTILQQAGSSPLNPHITIAASGIGAGPDGVTIRGFTFHGTDFEQTRGITIFNSTNINISNNIFNVGAIGTGIIVNDPVSTVNIVNNTFFHNGTAINRQSDMTSIRSNIFANNTIAIVPGPDQNAIAFNCFTGAGEVSGTDATTGDPLFANTTAIPPGIFTGSSNLIGDFHLSSGSACIDAGDSTDEDVLDETRADAGAYGGAFADPRPYPLSGLSAMAVATPTHGIYDIVLSWNPNLSYLTDRYFVYYADNPDDSMPTPLSIDVGIVTGFTLNNLSLNLIQPIAPILRFIAGNYNNGQVLDLDWTPIAGAYGYRVYYGISDAKENRIDVGNVTLFSLYGLEHDKTYLIGVTALHQPTHYLGVTARSMLLPAEEPEQKESALIFEPVPISDPIESPISNLIMFTIPEPDPCFIATAAYGHYSEPRVQLLRDFRDKYLLPSAAGRAFVEWYYRNSPNIAATIADNELLKSIIRILLLPLIGFAYSMLQFGAVFTGFIVLLIAIGLYLSRMKIVATLKNNSVPG